ncbi:MAG: hypothetical protein AAF800_06205 [Planctomycetota bacterium]
MKDTLKLTALLMSFAVVFAACSSDGGSDDDGDSGDGDDAVVKAARAAWPEYTAGYKETIDLTGYNVVTVVPLKNLTDNSQEEEAGQEFAEELVDELADRFEDAFTTVRIADAPLGQADEVVLRGQIYDYSKSRYSYWTGRTKNKFKAEILLENGMTATLLKSSQIREDSYGDSRDEMLEDAAQDTAQMLARSKE